MNCLYIALDILSTNLILSHISFLYTHQKLNQIPLMSTIENSSERMMHQSLMTEFLKNKKDFDASSVKEYLRIRNLLTRGEDNVGMLEAVKKKKPDSSVESEGENEARMEFLIT